MWFAIGLTIAFVLIMAVFALGGGAAIWERLAGPPDLGQYNFATLKRSATRNDALVCTRGLNCTGADEELPPFEGSAANVLQQIERRIELDLARSVRVDDGRGPTYRRYVTWSRFFGFPDTIDIEVIALEDGSSGVRAYGRAQIGREDFGANAKRLKDWLDVTSNE